MKDQERPDYLDLDCPKPVIVVPRVEGNESWLAWYLRQTTNNERS